MHRDRTRKLPSKVSAIFCRVPVVAALTALMPVSGTAAPDSDAAYARPQRRIDIGHGRKMNLYCVGTGTPTVIFDSGMSDWAFTWALVQPRIGLTARACAYDRAGLGYSDPGDRAGTSANMVDDLHRLLRAAGVPPPYVMVGHSLGGMNVRLYANRFPGEVSGMVLVDPVHEDAIARIDAERQNQETKRYVADIQRWHACVRLSKKVPLPTTFRKQCIEPADPRYSKALNAARVNVARRPAYQQAQLSEFENYLNGADAAALRATQRPYGDMPLRVLTSERTMLQAGPEWLHMHQELAALSRAGIQRTVAGASHYIQLDQPQEVINAIMEILRVLSDNPSN